MKNIRILFLAGSLVFALTAFAQKETVTLTTPDGTATVSSQNGTVTYTTQDGSTTASIAATAGNEQKTKTDSYDPLIPQLFAFDKENNVFAGINNTDNTIDLIRITGDKMERYNSILVDVVARRHDTHHIYRPKSVAIYENYIVFLASHRDSCYLAVLDMQGNAMQKLVFGGEASAFSYSHEARELYISGETAEGYDVIALNARNGMNNIALDDAAAMHYRKAKKSEVIKDMDPYGIGMAVIAMSVVFLGLLLLYLVFKYVGKVLVGRQNVRKKSVLQREEIVSVGDTSGAVYAAISAAIHMYNDEQHDEENAVLTINKVSRTYSPWSSKIHGLNTYFKR
ncbi:MAG: OadG family protein [Cytophagaceae bacterium]|jgi:Na+-transporting methylmalonyl-CoA/oxaloacetate decarboxylase gamma subunit|nr:OadG family protein [Cytophagaceae bacterium]